MVLSIPENEWTRVTYKDKYGNEVKTNQEVAEVCFVPETKNKSKNAPIFRYLATREAINIQTEITSEGQLTFMTSEYVEQKLHLEQINNTVYKIFGMMTHKTETPIEILL